jgi:hypothetical protein
MSREEVGLMYVEDVLLLDPSSSFMNEKGGV